MNKAVKKAVSFLAALSVLLGLSTGAAAAGNKTTVTKVEILDGENVVNSYVESYENVTLAPSNRMRVTIQLADDAGVKAGEVTFLSQKKNAALSDETIQYIDQKSAGDNGTIEVTFRPRILEGQFIARTSGEDVSAGNVAEFSYTVQKPAEQVLMTVVQDYASVEEGDNAPVKFNLTPAPGSITGVSINGTALAPSAYAYEAGVLTIPNAGVGRSKGSYRVTITADGYVTEGALFDVKEKPAVVIDPEEGKVALETALEPVKAEDGRSATLGTGKITVGETEYDVAYSIKSASSNKVTMSGATVSLNEAFAAKVTVEAKVTGTEVAAEKTFYLVPADAAISFGNIGLFSNASGEDAFTNDPDFMAAIEAAEEGELLEERTIALNLALGRGDITKDIPTVGTLDYDASGEITLAEYYIYKQMMDQVPGFMPSKIRAALGITE